MNTFNAICSAIFDVILAPFGHGPAWFDLLFWPILCGIGALVVYKYASNQKGIKRAKDQIKMHMLEIRLFRHDLISVVLSTVKIFLKNFIYVGHNMVPMAVMIVPMLVVLVQLEANYAFAPAQVGDVELLQVELDPATAMVKPTDVELVLPEGVSLDAPPVRTADGEIYWRLKAERAGDHQLKVILGDEVLEKGWAVGGEPRKVPVMKTKSLNAFLYPGEGGLPASSQVRHIAMAYPERDLGWLVGGELAILVIFFGLSLVAGFAFKDVFGVTL